jgi:tRNA-specific 2-thiouridylase
MKIVAAMSGGVDSSVAAAILKEEGHQVIGATMQVWPPDEPSSAVEDSRKAARQLGIPHHVIDLRDVFAQKVIAEFCREYSLGRTPNPCIICNRDIKFGVLLEKARELGADYIATGHYARIEMANDDGRYLLKKGAVLLALLADPGTTETNHTAAGQTNQGESQGNRRQASAYGVGKTGKPGYLLHPR